MKSQNTNELEKLLNKLTVNLDGKLYHSIENTFSSSQLKTMLQDPEYFYKKYITKEVEKEEGSHFDVGTYFHTAILEPKKLEEECAVYEGLTRRGVEWESFKTSNISKTIITKKEKEAAVNLISAINSSPICKSFLSGGNPEVSAFLKLYVLGGEVLVIKKGAIYSLQSCGWVAYSDYSQKEILNKAVPIIVKARADYLSLERRFISDLKSTSGNAKNEYDMRTKVDSFQYDLSCSMYLDIFSMCSGEDISDFYWLFASKDMGNAKAYRASEKNVIIGRHKWKKAILDLAYYIKNNWQFKDSLGEIGPSYFNLEWLEESRVQPIPEEDGVDLL